MGFHGHIEGDCAALFKGQGQADFTPHFQIAGESVKLHLATNNTTSCNRDFTIPSLNIDVLLDQTGEKVVDLPVQEAGFKLHFSCSKAMYTTGDIIYR